jgi:hypothetical protein
MQHIMSRMETDTLQVLVSACQVEHVRRYVDT